MITWDEPLRSTLGANAAKKLAAELDLHTAGDLLQHYPRRYVTRGELTDLAALDEGENATVQAEVRRANERRINGGQGGKPRNMLEVVVTDGTAQLTLAFFHKTGWHKRHLVPGAQGMFAGKVSSFRGRRQLAHPEYEMLPTGEDTGEERAREFAGKLIPVYPATKDLSSMRIQRCVEVLLDQIDDLDDPLPRELRQRHHLRNLRTALEDVHRPADRDSAEAALRRLKWDEAFVLQLALAQRHREASAVPACARPRVSGAALDAFDARLPFTRTDGQVAVGETVSAELETTHPMHRLLQGDVGSGKTLVALRAMLQVVDTGGQAVLLAPTEVLAQQHYHSIMAMLGPLAGRGQLGADERATRVTLLTGSAGAAARREALLEAASGTAGIVVGTHALLQEHVSFADLGLVVVDEQHRFGVEQRDALREKATRGRPHVLVMTATPIPRTVAMTVYGDLDVSVLDQVPAGRSRVDTHVVPVREKPHFLDRAWERITEEAVRGHQAFVVCPRIDGDGTDTDTAPLGEQNDSDPPPGESGGNEAEAGTRPPLAVSDVAADLSAGPLATVRVEALHGRLTPDEKEGVMRRFAAGEVDALVSTTVVEVGVDVPNATVMAIMDADRFGVSQLHQLRGRIGRGSLPGLCLLVTEVEDGTPARERLDAVAGTRDGFALSRVDLEQRREGDVLGGAQSGKRSSLRLLTLLRDADLIGDAREEAAAFVADDPELATHPRLARSLENFLERVDYLEKA